MNRGCGNEAISGIQNLDYGEEVAFDDLTRSYVRDTLAFEGINRGRPSCPNPLLCLLRCTTFQEHPSSRGDLPKVPALTGYSVVCCVRVATVDKIRHTTPSNVSLVHQA